MPASWALLLLLVTGIVSQQEHCGEWTYSDQDNWPEEHCSNGVQSPVDITSDATVFHPNFPPLAIDTASSGISTILSNDGRHIVISGDDLAVLGFLSGGPLYSESTLYGIVEVRFHFGLLVNDDVMSGSDHLVEGKSYAAELQFVAYNTMYPNFTIASLQANGIAIVSVLFELSPALSDNVDLNMFLDAASAEILYRGNDFSLDGINLRRLLPETITNYYTYSGSFTWPRCANPVTWIIMEDTLPITMDQLKRFQGVFTTRRGQSPSLPMAGNTRQTQDLGGRPIVASFLTGQAVALDGTHEGTTIPLGQTAEFLTPDESDARSKQNGNDIIFVVDQSGSSRVRRLHGWLRSTDFAVKLDTALSDTGFSNNRFGLVGFGQDLGGQASTIPVGDSGQLMGSSADLQAAFNSLISRGSMEDGYAGIQLALRAYDLRPTAHCVMMLMTDEGRDNLALDLNKELLAAELNRRNCTLHVAVHEHFKAGMNKGCHRRHRGHRIAFGVSPVKHAFMYHGQPGIEVVPWLGYPRLRSAHSNTHGAYVELAWLTGGSAFDILQLANAGTRDQLSYAETFSALLAQLRLHDMQQFNCRRCTAGFDSEVTCRRCEEDFPPQCAVTADPPTVFLGESGSLRCVASGHPAPTVSWRGSDGSTRFPPGVSVDGDMLRIASVTERSCYTCVVDGGRLGECDATGCVQVQGVIPVPIVSEAPPINQGGSAQFTCISTGYPEPEIVWGPAADCTAAGDTLTCRGLSARICVTCTSSNRLGSGSDTKCVDVFAPCQGGVQHNSHRRQFTPDASIPADNMHMVVLFDESRTMLTERSALPGMISDVDAALEAVGFGTSIANRYSLVGFAGSSAPQGRLVDVGGGVCGSAQELGTASASLSQDGRTEDGYSAINVALQQVGQCDAGPNSQLVIFLMTDEDRDVLRGFGTDLTFDVTLQSLGSANARFSAAVKQDYRDQISQESAYGMDSQGQAFVITEGGSGFEVSPNGQIVRDSGFGTTERDYVQLARQTGGSFFNVRAFRSEGTRTGFIAALSYSLSAQLASERVRPLCAECRCDAGVFDCTNLPRIQQQASCMQSAEIDLGVSVRADPVFALRGEEIRLYCTGNVDQSTVVAQWSPHPIGAFQNGTTLHFPMYMESNLVTYTCTMRTADGRDSDSVTVDVAPLVGR